MKAIALANMLIDAAYLFGDLEVVCCDVAGDLDPVTGVTHQVLSNRLVVAVHTDDFTESTQ